MAKMRALVKEGSLLEVRSYPSPEPSAGDTVVVRVAMAGLCRTDLYAAEGAIAVADPLILGHELSGVVEATGVDVEGVSTGDRVTVNPWLPCGRCDLCASGMQERCQQATFLGVDRHGAFAELVAVPSDAVTRLGDDVSFVAAAYAEPVAASLAVLKCGISPSDQGLVIGNNRFSRLMGRILHLKGFRDIATWTPGPEGEEMPPPSAYDFVIETMATDQTLRAMVEAVRPGGTLILKSRQPTPLTIDLIPLIRKEPVVRPVNYGSFTEAVGFISTQGALVEDLVDGVYQLEDFADVFARASVNDELKPFFVLSDL